jgi:iron(III) transport system substrate-binding protein
MSTKPSHRRRTTRVAALTVALGMLAAACGGDDADDATADQPADEAPTTEAPTADEPADEAPTADEPQASGTVTVYIGRQYGIEPVFESFTEATGIEVRFTSGGDPELRERLIAEGVNTPADLVLTADAANIELSAQAGVLAPIDSEALNTAIPEDLRSEDNLWFSLSRRARVPIYSIERVTEPPLTYADVGDPQWQGRVCLRPSTHPYTQSLVASIIAAEGEERALEIVESWVANDPLYINSDTDIYRAVAAGECDVALANTYYLGRLQLEEDPDFPVAISWPEQDGRGAHINVSAGAVTANAPNPEAARALLEWLATDGQQEFADANSEYPADPTVPTSDVVAAWGEFVDDTAVVRQLGGLNPAAVDLLSVAGYE